MEREGFFDSKPQCTPSSSSRLQPRKSPGQHNGLMSPETWIAKKDEVVAWIVNDEGDTASQSTSTDLIQGRTHSYTLDKVYGPDSITKNLYDNSVNPLVKAAMEGYHSSILAYGQTSTGKTFTMTGTRTSPGLIPRCIGDCFRYIKSCPNNREYLFRLSYLEVYNEHIRDLLAETPQPIRLFENQSDGLIIKGLKEEIVTSPDHVFSILRQGEKRRQVGATHMNLHSSRSHTMVRLWIESTDSNNNNSNGQSYTTPSPAGGRRGKSSNSSAARISSLSLVDLAGSESVRLNGGDRRDEGTYINKSLMTLGKVVSALSENNKSKISHIPYRDSKLTRLLQPSLSGNARMVLICCISPVASHLEESHNTFKFATRAKRIEQKAVINHAGDNEQTLLQTYRDEIDDLRRQLAEAKEEQEKLKEKQQRGGNGGGSAISSSSPAAGPNAAEEVEELLEAIQSMERLILKSRQGSAATPSGVEGRPPLSNNNNNAPDENARASKKDEDDDESEVDLLSELLDDELNEQDDNKDVLDLRVDAVVSTSRSGESSQWGGCNPDASLPASPPRKEEEDDLDGELRRIRGLLGSVLQRRGASPTKVGQALEANSTAVSPEKSPPRFGIVSSNLFGTPQRNGNGTASVLVETDEVQTLKKQLIQQEATTNLSKADATFLQNQLREKDDLLEEIAKVLEAVEKRQTELEKENAALRLELAAVTSQSRISQN
jgi:hypothetical protein